MLTAATLTTKDRLGVGLSRGSNVFSMSIIKLFGEVFDIYLWMCKDKPASTLLWDPNANLTSAPAK